MSARKRAKCYNSMSYMGTSMVVGTISRNMERGATIRILEVGAGSGKSARQLLNNLRQHGIPVHYTFTDISLAFITAAKKVLGKSVHYGILSIDDDPQAQGFAPHIYDIIIAVEVVHCVIDIKRGLRNMRTLLRPNGMIVLSEIFKSTHKMAFSFGMLDSWWRFNDFRRYSPLVDAETWKTCLMDSGYDRCVSVDAWRGEIGVVVGRSSSKPVIPHSLRCSKSWIFFECETDLAKKIFTKLEAWNRNVIHVKLRGSMHEKISGNFTSANLNCLDNISELLENLCGLEGIIFMADDMSQAGPEQFQSNYCRGLLKLCKKLIKHNLVQKQHHKQSLFVVTRGMHYIGDSIPGDPNGATLWGMLKSVQTEYPELQITLIDAELGTVDIEVQANEIFCQLWSQEKELFVSFRQGKKFVQRLVKVLPIQPIVLPQLERFKIIVPESHSLEDLKVTPAYKVDLAGDTVEIRVHCCALNFWDLLVILQPVGFVMPSFMPSIGLDISGIVSGIGPEVSRYNIGDKVFAFTTNGGLGSHTIIEEKRVLRMPHGVTFASASTLPCAFLTVLQCLIKVAKLTKADKILIHVASGGVGLAAIQITKYIGAEIYATAGSNQKRTYLRSIGIANVYHSRNTNYAAHIAKDSQGKGVTVVLNSLTGPGFKEASLKVCALGARFIELGKINIWTEKEVSTLRSDVKYSIVDVARMAHDDPLKFLALVDVMNAACLSKTYRGLPHATFPLDLVREAFFHLQESKHIGKVVITMPQPYLSIEGRFVLRFELFNRESTYLITGGLGGLGLELVKWMTAAGAQNIVISGRTPPNLKAQQLIDQLNYFGSRIIVIQADVAKYDQVVSLLDTVQRIRAPPIRGIMHAAGFVSNSGILNNSWDKYLAKISTKVFGGWNLHCLTRNYDLDFFVSFSTVAAIIGIPTQSSDAACNMYLDSLANHRLSLGLPATSINWALPNVNCGDYWLKRSTKMASGENLILSKGIRTVERILRERQKHVTVVGEEFWDSLKHIVQLGDYLSELSIDKTDNCRHTALKLQIEQITVASQQERNQKLSEVIELVLRHTLRFSKHDKLGHDQDFRVFGADSLMMMQVWKYLQSVSGNSLLTMKNIQKNRTIRSLAAHMSSLLNHDHDTSPAGSVPKFSCLVLDD